MDQLQHGQELMNEEKQRRQNGSDVSESQRKREEEALRSFD